MNTTSADISYIYFIKADRYVKIGKTNKHICTRMASMQTGNPFILTCPFYIAVAHRNRTVHPGNEVEMIVQSICSPARKRNEWFHYHAAMRLVFENWQSICELATSWSTVLAIAMGTCGETQLQTMYPYNGCDDEKTRKNKFLEALNKRR